LDDGNGLVLILLMAMSMGILELVMREPCSASVGLRTDGFWARPEGYRSALPFGFFLSEFGWHRMGAGVAQLLMKPILTVREKIP
jgi:hypothetical protein